MIKKIVFLSVVSALIAVPSYAADTTARELTSRRIVIWPYAMTDAQLQAITA